MKRKVLSFDLKDRIDEVERIDAGREFQSFGPTAEKARAPIEVLMCGV